MRELILICLLSAPAFSQDANLGIFKTSGDVGNPAIKGSAEFANGQYKLTGAGANIWAKQDQFQFIWREMPGNFTLAATMKFLGQGADHRKAGIMVRQTLDTDSAYADVVIHGNGMPGLQWRSRQGEDTNAFDLPFDGPGTFKIKLVRTGVKMYLYLGKEGAETTEIAHTEVTFRNPVLVGLFVCSHKADASDTVVFSDVSLESQAAPPPALVRLTIETGFGNIEAEIDTVHAPVTAANFLRYVDAGSYNGGDFHRTVRADNQRPNSPNVLGVIQAKRAGGSKALPPISLERTSVTGLSHNDGILSMARTKDADSATSAFFICIDDQTPLDFGGKGSLDGQGYAAFGHVIQGMDIVRRIQAASTDGAQQLTPPVRILSIRRK